MLRCLTPPTSLPPLLISDSVSLNHSLPPPPELELTLLMENLEFFILQIQLPQIIPQPTPKLEQLTFLDFSNHSIPPNL